MRRLGSVGRRLVGLVGCAALWMTGPATADTCHLRPVLARAEAALSALSAADGTPQFCPRMLDVIRAAQAASNYGRSCYIDGADDFATKFRAMADRWSANYARQCNGAQQGAGESATTAGSGAEPPAYRPMPGTGFGNGQGTAGSRAGTSRDTPMTDMPASPRGTTGTPSTDRDARVDPTSRPDNSSGSRSYKADGGNVPGDIGETSGPRKYLHSEGMARYTSDGSLKTFSIVPQHKTDGRTYVFADAGHTGQCNAGQLEALRSRIPGAMRATGDTKLSFANLVMNMRYDQRALIRYHFLDCSKGLDHYQGLMCFAYPDQQGSAAPVWEACGLVDEMKSLRR